MKPSQERFLLLGSFSAGLLAVVWVALGYAGAHPLALAMTLLIGAFYIAGAAELRRFHQATATLAQALDAVPEPPESTESPEATGASEPLPGPRARLADWLGRLHPSLQNAVRLRIEGERVGLPGPVMTPYLVGLLVLLGMLGTFLGMVVTLNGTVTALETSTDLQTMRAALAAPVRGLGLAFGTSVAGVAASGMLGLLSTLCRRARLQAAQRLDARIASTLHRFSAAQQLATQRQTMLDSLQAQARAMPEVVGQLQALVQRMDQQGQSLGHSMDQQARALTQAMDRQAQAMDQRALALGQQLDQQAQGLAERLQSGQDGFHRQAESVYTQLARSVDRSLQQSLAESARVAGATLQPVAEATMAGIARQTGELHQRLADTVQQQLDGLAQRFGHSVDGVTQVWTAALATHERTSARLADDTRSTLDGFAQGFEQRSSALVQGLEQRAAALSQEVEQRSATLLDSLARGQAQAQAAAAASDAQRLSAWTEQLSALARGLQQEWQQAGATTLEQQQQILAALDRSARDIGSQAEAQARSTIAEIARLMQVASEAPRVAAEVIAALRQQLSDSLVRDNALLDERGRLMAALQGLLEAVTHTTTEQRGAVQTLVDSSAAMLAQVGERFSGQVAAEADRLTAAATQVGGSAVEVASLGEAFGTAVQLFSDANERMLAQLQRIDTTLGQAIARSDEQLAYYVAQAREIIDLSLLSQKQVVDDLQRLADRQKSLTGEAA